MLRKWLNTHYHAYAKGDKNLMETLPQPAFWAVWFMTLSVLVQGIMDIVIKLAGFTPWFVAFPWRIDFLFLTAVSVLMGVQTLAGIRRRELDVTRNSVQIGILVETALVVGDLAFIKVSDSYLPEAFTVRMPFVIFTSINILILLYLVWRLDLLRNKKGEFQLF